MATYGLHVPDNWPFEAEFWKHVHAHFHGRPGSYLRAVVEKDLISMRRSPASEIMVELAERMLGEVGRDEMREALRDTDQRKELQRLLQDYLAHTSEKPKRSTHPFVRGK